MGEACDAEAWRLLVPVPVLLLSLRLLLIAGELDADFGGLPRPRFGVTLWEADRGEEVDDLGGRPLLFGLNSLFSELVRETAECCEALREAEAAFAGTDLSELEPETLLDEATMISSSTTLGSGRRSLGITNRLKKLVIFEPPGAPVLLGAIAPMYTSRTCTVSTHRHCRE